MLLAAANAKRPRPRAGSLVTTRTRARHRDDGGRGADRPRARAATTSTRSGPLRRSTRPRPTPSACRLRIGAALRRANLRTDARRHLAAARHLALRVDATALVRRAAEGLTIAGGRPRRIAVTGLDALTPSERCVAEHASRGLTNREIAETLFVTRKTVEYQLGGSFSKLGIRLWTDLAGVLQPGVER